MNRRDLFRAFAATAGGVLMPEPVRVYSFAGGWALGDAVSAVDLHRTSLGHVWPPGWEGPSGAVIGDFFWSLRQMAAFVFTGQGWARLICEADSARAEA